MAAYIGGQNAKVVYAGSSSDAGVDQINVTLPSSVTGCYVPAYLVATSSNGKAVTSNFGTVSIAGSGSFYQYTPTYLTSAAGFNVDQTNGSCTVV